MNECDLHQMFGCAVCSGADASERHPHAGAEYVPWTAEENRVARSYNLTTAEVARRLGRTVNQVSAHRTNILRMVGWKGYVSKGHAKLPR